MILTAENYHFKGKATMVNALCKISNFLYSKSNMKKSSSNLHLQLILQLLLFDHTFRRVFCHMKPQISKKCGVGGYLEISFSYWQLQARES